MRCLTFVSFLPSVSPVRHTHMLIYTKYCSPFHLQVPITVTPGKHKVVVEGLVGSENAVFRNSSALIFDTKYVSMFIQTDRPVYYSSWVPNNEGKFQSLSTGQKSHYPPCYPPLKMSCFQVITTGADGTQHWWL